MQNSCVIPIRNGKNIRCDSLFYVKRLRLSLGTEEIFVAKAFL